jgi:hypothetical protein
MISIYRLIVFLVLGGVGVVSPAAMADAEHKDNPTLTDADPFQRYAIFKNEMPFTIWPVLEVPDASNGGPKDSGLVHRILVNSGSRGAGVPSGETVRVNIPKNDGKHHRWYKSGRIFIFTVDPEKMSDVIVKVKNNATFKTVEDKEVTGLCAGCWAGTAKAAYPKDSPTQIGEYTVLSKDWTGKSKQTDGPDAGKPSGEYPDQDDPNGDPFIDIDVSYVDDVYLPVAMNLDDGGATGYMGTTLTADEFKQRVSNFLNNPAAGWQNYAAYDEKAWDYNLFGKLAMPSSGNKDGKAINPIKDMPHIPAGYNIIHEVMTKSSSVLYSPVPDPAKKACNKNPACKALGLTGDNDCCPVKNNEGEWKMNACCDGGIEYVVGNTSRIWPTDPPGKTDVEKENSLTSNPSLDAIYNRWKPWIEGNPCANIGKIKNWPSDQIDKQGFCDAFGKTVKWVWDQTYNNDTAIFECGPVNKEGKTNDHGFPIGSDGYKRCMLGQVIGYKVGPNGGRQPESVQALMRNVPWGDYDKGEREYQWDKFLHFWAPYDSEFNLNPYVKLVKDPKEKNGLNAMSGYSFSIDDLWGNYQDAASGFIVNVGGSSGLLNRDQFDPYTKFKVSVGPGWDHMKFCSGRTIPSLTVIDKDNNKGGKPAFFSFWVNKAKVKKCEIAIYPNKSEDTVFKYRLEEYEKEVTDNWTKKKQKVRGMRVADDDANFCTQNSSPSLVSLCDADKAHLVPEMAATDSSKKEIGGKENVYVSVDEKDRPMMTLTVPPPPAN